MKHYRGYESEITQLIGELKRRDPELEKRQWEARAIWWDKPPLHTEDLDQAQSEVGWKAYPYD